MELFTALQMGRKAETISLVLIGGGDGADQSGADLAGVRASFRDFRGERAECFKKEDKERLLAVIESSFGDFGRFNAIVKGVFEARQHAAASAAARSPQELDTTPGIVPDDVAIEVPPSERTLQEYPVRVRAAVHVDASPILLYMQAWFEADQRRRAEAAAPGGDELMA